MTEIIKLLAPYGKDAIFIGILLAGLYYIFKRIMDEAKEQRITLLREAMEREERILKETNEREGRLVAERQAAEALIAKNQVDFLKSLSEVCQGISGIEDRVEGVEGEVKNLVSSVGEVEKQMEFLKGVVGTK